ncbi:MAG: DUF177 domain-containing protein [Bacilli bacterium]|nr:DUF177 domain-containing protein [Bacilli bacterium]
MIIDLNELYKKGIVIIDENVEMGIKDSSLGIKKLENLKLLGKITYNDFEELDINLKLTGTMYLLDAMTLEEIPYEFESNIEESIVENEINIEKYIDKSKNILDIQEILWENIVLEVPIRVRKDNSDISLEGEGWQLNKEDKEEIDPRLAKLTELLKDRKE